MSEKPEEPKSQPPHRIPCGTTLHLAQRGPYLWEEPDLKLLDDSLARIRDAGLELVRLPLVWEGFQPRPLSIPTAMLHRFVQVLDRAASTHLVVLPWLFVGPWMGESFLPPWTLGPPGPPGASVYSNGRRRSLPRLDLWTDPELLDAQRRLLEELTQAASGHPALWGWEVAAAPERAFGPASASVRASWLRRHSEFLAERSPGLQIGASLDAADVPVLAPQIALSMDWIGLLPPQQTFAWAEGALDPHLLPFFVYLLRWLTGCPALVHALGTPARPPTDEPLEAVFEDLPSEALATRHAERLLELLPIPDLAGVVAQFWADAGPRLASQPPYDRAPQQTVRGLVREDQKPKPILDAYARWIASSASRRLRSEAATTPEQQPTAQQLMIQMGVPEPPRARTSSFLALPGGADFERLARELGLSDKPAPPPPDRRRGIAPEWTDLEPEELERDPDQQLPRLYKRFRGASSPG